ncbi:MAG TPA: CDP-alcohol phosphatidyltransferase family protein [Polyangiaceae bacterium]|nr:CDP-alcohol phosphatidyltransferase family protein [Polyangiaceae bacterium]
MNLLEHDIPNSGTGWIPSARSAPVASPRANLHAIRSTAPAAARLAGTIWERSDVAVLAYRSFYALGVGLGKLGISANAITYTSVVLAGLSAVAAAQGHFLVSALVLALGGLCDALDGIVARSTGRVSKYGALLDSTVDRVSDVLPLIGMMMFQAKQPWFVLPPAFALVTSFVIPYVRARAEALGVVLPGLFMRRPERTLMLIACLAVAGATPQPGLALLVGSSIMALLNAYGCFLVLRSAQRALGQAEIPAPAAASDNPTLSA